MLEIGGESPGRAGISLRRLAPLNRLPKAPVCSIIAATLISQI